VDELRRDASGILCLEGVPLDEIADRYGTPVYAYGRAAIAAAYRDADAAFEGRPHTICYAVKANPNGAVLRALAELGAGADIVSGGELYRALRAGIPPERIVFSGVGKSRREMAEALRAGILMFNVETFTELEALDETARAAGTRAPVALRVNPDVDARTHPYVATGLRSSKFGIRHDRVLEGYERARRLPNVDVIGISCHVGSQLVSLGPFTEAARHVGALTRELVSAGFDLRVVDLGGGLGIRYDEETPPAAAEYGRAVSEALGGVDACIVVEPGRSIVGNAGVLLTRALYTKKADDARFAVVDAGMNDLLRPSLYGSFHGIEHVAAIEREAETTDVVGPICETGDFLAKKRTMTRVVAGDLLAVLGAGAYGFAMASTYNSRPLAAEVMVRDGRHRLVRERGTYEDLVRGEVLAEI
jgi:diaminopimelate decarboxylase